MWHPEMRVEKYRISGEEFARLDSKSWSPFKNRQQVASHVDSGSDCTAIPEKVTHADWSYCMLVTLFKNYSRS
jgi:hypothetical protein